MIDLNTLLGRDRAEQRGFTLLELMIVLAVVTILTVIAISSYTEQVHKSRRANAYNLVGQFQLALERQRAENPCYDQSGNSGCSAAYTQSGTYPSTPTDTYYTITPTFSTSQPFYKITAAPKSTSAQKNDRCGTLCALSPGATDSSSGGLICSATTPKWSNSACN